jgi:hypothetical protein
MGGEHGEEIGLGRWEGVALLVLDECMTMEATLPETADHQLAPNGLYRSELEEVLERVVPEAFGNATLFDGYAEYMEGLERLYDHEWVPTLRQRKRIALTEAGQEAAAQLRERATDAQQAAIADATPGSGE